MAEHKYSFENYDPETMSRAVGRSLPVSTKHCIEISSYLRGKKLKKAKVILDDAINLRKPIPFKRFNADVGHRKGEYSAGRYVVKAAKEVLKLLNSCEANAQNKALNTDDMLVTHINAHRGTQQFRMGRQRRRRAKRTHVEVILAEVSKKQRVPGKDKPAKEEQKTKVTKEEQKVKDTKEEQKTKVTKEEQKVKDTKEEQKTEDTKGSGDSAKEEMMSVDDEASAAESQKSVQKKSSSQKESDSQKGSEKSQDGVSGTEGTEKHAKDPEGETVKKSAKKSQSKSKSSKDVDGEK